jgi:L-threonylcarbamoyladenylate synthase
MSTLNTLFLENTPQNISKAADIIRSGGVVAVPTETVYGLAADATNAQAVAKIFSAKGRPNNHPLIVHIHDKSQLNKLAKNVSVDFKLLADAFWPGPLTVLLDKSDAVIDAVTGGLSTIGVRMPNHPVLRELLATGDFVVAAPSANPHKRLSPTTAQQVFQELKGKIDAVIDGGHCNVGLESTIVDLAGLASEPNKDVKVLRAGPILPTQLQAVLNRKVRPYQSHEHQVPGNIEQHYQPTGTLQVVSSATITQALVQWPDSTCCLWFSDSVGREFSKHKGLKTSWFKQMSAEKAEYAREFYNALYQLDQKGFSTIWVEQPPQTETWADVNDRLARASA